MILLPLCIIYILKKQPKPHPQCQTSAQLVLRVYAEARKSKSIINKIVIQREPIET